MSSNKYAAFFAIYKQMNSAGFTQTREELIEQYTEGEKSSLTELEHIQYTEFCSWLRRTFQTKDSGNPQWQQSPENKMRRKLFRIFVTEMKYSKTDFENWFIKYGMFHRPLKDHSKEQLQLVLTQAEKVLGSFIRGINN